MSMNSEYGECSFALVETNVCLDCSVKLTVLSSGHACIFVRIKSLNTYIYIYTHIYIYIHPHENTAKANVSRRQGLPAPDPGGFSRLCGKTQLAGGRRQVASLQTHFTGDVTCPLQASLFRKARKINLQRPGVKAQT